MSIRYPAEWVRQMRRVDKPSDYSPGDLIPMEILTDPIPGGCPNCKGVGSVFAREVKARHSAIHWIDGYAIRCSLIEAPCPVCAEGNAQEYLIEQSGLRHLQLDGKPAFRISLSDGVIQFGQGDAWKFANLILSEMPYTNKWFFVSGAHGTGKTHLLMGLINGCRLTNVLSYYATVSNILMQIKATFNQKGLGTPTTDDVVQRYIDVPILAVDEFHRTGNTEWSDQQLIHILEQRYLRNRPLFIASNYGPEALSKKSEPFEAIMSRFGRDNMITVLTNTDLRPKIPNYIHE